MTVTSLPEGAEVSINHRVVGKTPIRVPYTHYGDYRIELRQDRHETIVKNERIYPPWYGYDPIAFVADNVVPARINDETSLHYVMKPVEPTNKNELLQRARQARDGKITNPATGELVQVHWAYQPKTIADTKPAETPTAAPTAVTPVETKAETPPPTESVIKDKMPEGPKLSREPGQPEEKKAPAKDDAEAKRKEKEQREKQLERMRRKPEDESLIFEDKPVEEPKK